MSMVRLGNWTMNAGKDIIGPSEGVGGFMGIKAQSV
jgi:hypothetical protein